MIHFHIEAETVSDLQRELLILLGTAKTTQAIMEGKAPMPAPEKKVPVPEISAVPVPGVNVIASSDIDAPTTEACRADPSFEENAPSMVETREALNNLRAAKGPKAVREILNAHKVSTFVDLKSDEYSAVIAEAMEAAR